MSFKHYAKQAKKRLSEGFWNDIIEERQREKEVAATTGRSILPTISAQIEEVRNRIYSHSYEVDKQFEQKVYQLLQSNEVILNPISLLADDQYMQTLSPSAKQAYLFKISNRYREIKSNYDKNKLCNDN